MEKHEIIDSEWRNIKTDSEWRNIKTEAHYRLYS